MMHNGDYGFCGDARWVVGFHSCTNMAAKDSIMFGDMIQMMKVKPEMWSKVMKMRTSTTKIN